MSCVCVLYALLSLAQKVDPSLSGLAQTVCGGSALVLAQLVLVESTTLNFRALQQGVPYAQI